MHWQFPREETASVRCLLGSMGSSDYLSGPWREVWGFYLRPGSFSREGDCWHETPAAIFSDGKRKFQRRPRHNRPRLPGRFVPALQSVAVRDSSDPQHIRQKLFCGCLF